MYLVDNEIIGLINRGYGIVNGFDKNSLGSISYDMHLDQVYQLTGEQKPIENNGTYLFKPMEPVIVKLKEKIKVPPDGIIKLEPRNYVIRMGLDIKSTVYQPGHETYCFIRVINMTDKDIKLQENFSLVQAMFGKLNFVPDKLYGTNGHDRYQNERKYIKSNF